jgi:hypothetical protein
MPQFDVAGARKAGYSDAEILSHLTSSRKFDVAGARKSGYNDTEIIDYLSKEKAPSAAPSRVFSSILERSTRNLNADVTVRRMEQEPLSRPKVGGGPATGRDTLLGGLKEQFVDPLYRPLEEAKLAIEGIESDQYLNYSPDKEPIRYNIASALSPARKQSLNLVADLSLDPLNALPVGTLLTKARPAIRIGADVLFAAVVEAGAIKALKEGRYEDAGVQQAFALIGAGMGHSSWKNLSEGRKRLIFEEARTREKVRTDAQIKTDVGFYRKLTEQTKERATSEVEQFNRLKAKAEGLEPETPVSGETPTQPTEIPAVPVEQKPVVSGAPKKESTTKSLYEDLGVIRQHPAKGNPNPSQEEAIEYIAGIRQAAETHMPEAIPLVEKAEAAVQAGDMPGFVKAAEDARGELRKSYGERLAADEAARQGVELPPKHTGVPVGAKQPPITIEQVAMETAETYMQNWADEVLAADTALAGKAQRKYGVGAEGAELARRANYQDPTDPGAGTRTFGGGYKENTPLEKFTQNPGVLAKAIKNRKGKLYEEMRAAFLEDVMTHEKADMQSFVDMHGKTQADVPGELSGPAPENPDLSFDFGESILESFSNMERQARERMEARGGKGRMGSEKGASPILDDINDLITIGVAKIGKGTIRFARWSAEMISEFGERVRPHLQEIYSKSLERARELKDFDADEYFNFRRVKLSEGEKQRLIDRVTEETLATGRVPKEKITFDQVREEARQIAGDDILKYVESARKGATEYRAARFAMRQRINSLSSEVVGLRQKVAELGGVDPAQAMNLERELLVKESDLSALLDSHMRIRSEEGRNLAINRMEADSTWDAAYWMNRARQAEGLPPGVPPSDSTRKKIMEIFEEGRKAQDELDEAIKVETTWGTQQEFPPPVVTHGPPMQPTPAPPVPSTPVLTTWVTQPGLPGIPGSVPPPPTPTGRPGQPPPAIRARVTRARMAVQVARQNMASTVTKLQKSGWLETISSLRKAGLFGVFTRVRNIGANAAFQVAEEVSRLPAVLVDMAMSLGGSDRQVQGISPRAIAKSAYYAATQGLRDAGDAIRYGVTTNELGKVEVQKPLNSGVRWLDNFANFQFREMSAEDRIFKSYAFRRSLEEQLWLESRRTGQPMPSEAIIQSGIQAAKSRGQGSGIPAAAMPDESMIANAIAYAEYATFNNRNMLASALRSGQATLRTKGPAGQAASFAVDMVVPFANTPANVIARQFDYTALGAVPRMVTAAIRGLNGPERRTFELAMGRGLTGSALIYAGWKLSEKGLATGTWEEEAGQRNVAEAAGRTPGAVRVGDRWIGTGQLAPSGSLIMVGAALQREATQPLKNEMGRLGKVAAIGTKAALEQPFLAGMSNLVEAMQNPGNRGERFASGMIGSFIPTYLSEISSGFDPYLRDARPEGTTETLYKGAQARTPGRFQLPERLDVLGRPRSNSIVGSEALEISDSIRNELQSNSVSVGFPQRKPDETATTYRLRSQLVGRLIDERVGLVLRRPSYPTADTEKRRGWLDKAVSDAREQASSTLDRKFKTEEAHEKFLLEQIDRVESRLKGRKSIPMIPIPPVR